MWKEFWFSWNTSGKFGFFQKIKWTFFSRIYFSNLFEIAQERYEQKWNY